MEDLSRFSPTDLTRRVQELQRQACPDKESEAFYNRNMQLAKGMGMTWVQGLQFVISQRKGLTCCRGCERMAGMNSVWLLWFEGERVGDEDTDLLIGAYRTAESAKAAIERVKDQPGFRDYPQGFAAHEYPLDQDHWTQGFVRV